MIFTVRTTATAQDHYEETETGETSHMLLVCSVSPCSHGDSWRFMLIHALRMGDTEHQSHLNIKVISNLRMHQPLA